MKKLHVVALIPVALTLTACGGGGSGGSSVVASFVRYSAVGANETVTIGGGLSQEAAYTYDTVNERVLTYGAPSSVSTTAEVSASYDSNQDVATISFNSGNGTSLTYSSTADTFTTLPGQSSILAMVKADGSNYILLANPYDFNYDYQTFGVWATGVNSGSGTVGGFSYGNTTAVSAIPTSGTATYLGDIGGFYSNSSGVDKLMSADLTASANFANRTIGVATSNSIVTDLSTYTSNSSLDFTGTLSYSSGSNEFSGTITTGGGMSGSMTGVFYGPAANEIGGTYAAQGSGVEGMIGGFGAVRQ